MLNGLHKCLGVLLAMFRRMPSRRLEDDRMLMTVSMMRQGSGGHRRHAEMRADFCADIHTFRDRPVSYTHLDVYKRQVVGSRPSRVTQVGAFGRREAAGIVCIAAEAWPSTQRPSPVS